MENLTPQMRKFVSELIIENNILPINASKLIEMAGRPQVTMQFLKNIAEDMRITNSTSENDISI